MDYPHLERLSTADCRRLLPGAAVGRLVVPGPTFPSVEPVSFAVVEGEVVVALRAGSAGDAVAAGTVVAFEADVLDRRLRQGWSVAVNGAVEDLDADVAELVRPLVSPWPAAPGDRLILVRSERVSGRRIVTAPEPAAGEPFSPGAAAAVGGDRPVLTRRELASDAALDVLRRGDEPVGRLAVSLGGEPLIFPLNFAVDGDAVVFRTEVGTKLSAITRSLVTFEVDQLDDSGQGWAVTFEGLAQEVLDSDPASLLARIDALALDTWPGGDRPHVVRITPYAVRGTAWTPAPVTAVGGGRSGAA